MAVTLKFNFVEIKNRMTKIILFTSVLVVAVFTVAYLYFSNLSAGSRNIDQALSQIPNDAALVFEINNDQSIYDIFSDYQLFNALIGKQKQEEILLLKSLLVTTSEIFQKTEGQNMYLSFHPKNDSVALLWIMPLPEEVEPGVIAEALATNRNMVLKKTDFEQTAIYELFFPTIKRTFFLHIDANFICGSYSKNLFKDALNNKIPKISHALIEEINQANSQNQNSPASLFVNFKGSIPYLQNFFKNNLNGNFELLNNFNAIAPLSMNFKSDALVFTGSTVTDTSKQNYFNLFLKQKAIKNTIKRVVPDNTANFISYGVSNYHEFHEGLLSLFKLRKEFDKLDGVLTKIRDESGISADRDLKKLWANEFITFQLSTQEKYAAIQLKNGRQMQFFMEPLSSRYSEEIWHIDYPGLFYYYFGDGLKQFNKPFYAILDNQMILSNSPGSIQRYLNRYSRNSLFTNTDFVHFDKLVGDQSNISIFIHNQNSASNIKSLLRPAYADVFSNPEFGFKNFYGLSYQWSSDGNRFFTTFYTGYNQNLIVDDKTTIPDSLSINN